MNYKTLLAALIAVIVLSFNSPSHQPSLREYEECGDTLLPSMVDAAHAAFATQQRKAYAIAPAVTITRKMKIVRIGSNPPQLVEQVCIGFWYYE